MLALAGFIARAAASILGGVGVSAHAAANVLWTPRGGFLVTQECISTPLIPVYLAAVCAYSTTWRRLILGVVAAAPLFIALGIVRLLVVALPAAVVASPLFLVHAFYQLLLGAVVVLLAALWRHGRARRLRHALAGVIAGRRGSSISSARSTRASSHIRPVRRSTIRRARSRSFPRSSSASTSRSGSRRSSRSAGGASSPGSRCSGSRRRRPARAARPRQPFRACGARARRPRLGDCRPLAHRCRGGQRCAGRVAEVVGRPGLRRDRHRGDRGAGPARAVRARLRHGDRRAPPRPVHGDGAIRAADHPRRVFAAGHRPHRRAARAPFGRGGRLQLARPSQLSAVGGGRLSARAASGAAAGGRAVAAMAFAFSPFHLAHAAYHPHIAQTQWMPLYCWRCGAVWTTPRRQRSAFLCVATVAVTLSNFYGGLIAAVITPVAMAAYWLGHAPATGARIDAPAAHHRRELCVLIAAAGIGVRLVRRPRRRRRPRGVRVPA